MKPIFVDIHIHTSDDPDNLNSNYPVETLISKIKEFTNDSDFLISLTDHNTINENAYLKAVQLGVNIILGVELHIKNYEDCPAYHCHIYFDVNEITQNTLVDINAKLNKLYPKKVVEKLDPTIPTIQQVINEFDNYEFILLPHGGQSHATFDTSIPEGVKFDTTLEKSIYYNQFDGFTARGNRGLERTQEYFIKLGINEFVNLITCSDNYNPTVYPNGKDQNPYIPTWMLALPTFNGLRLSLSESSRLIYSETKPEFWSENIESISLNKANIEIDVKFKSGLNVVIGSSSSGKSLLVDSIYKNITTTTAESIYLSQYEIDKVVIKNPSGMTPHFLSQNYIMSVVNNVSENKIDDIDIIKNVFPGDDEVKEQITRGLAEFKKDVIALIKQVRIIDKEIQNFNNIPVISRLIINDNLQSNPFKSLQPSDLEKSRLEFSKSKYDNYNLSLDEVEEFLSRYPFVKHNLDLIKELKSELELAYNNFFNESSTRKIVDSYKKEFDDLLRENNSEDQSKKLHFEKLIETLKIYVKAYKRFNEILSKISSYNLNFGSEVIESMGHKLYIENDFKLDKEKFIEIVNYYLKIKIDRFENITPNLLFETNHKGKNPKVHGYDDFEKKIYTDFENLNRKNYKIITQEGKDFDSLSPGWKTSVILDLILGYEEDISPIIIDQPEDNLATNYINKGLVNAIKKIKAKKQVILVSHNATIPMLADAQNIILCRNIDNKIVITSCELEGKIGDKYVVDYIAEITDGGKSSIKKRVKKYNLKKYNES
ncbi:ATPase [Chryseobacterium sp. MEBOG06]|uniref:ATPase n=1 Tax=Chryseobacterium sp. MEBOG06 TaxID=2879938 RepID=UPI001F32529F|nr:ATPase [Chryseobacterium sp. MEBOG06]UKB82191.1 ATPase [Chryseobacterium sp. MEBOG06]